MVRHRPEMSPHFKTPIGVDRKTPILRINGKRRMAQVSTGQVDLDSLRSLPIEHVRPLEPQPEEPHRSFWFKKGTVLYSIDFPIPGSPLEAQNRQAQVLGEAQPLQIDAENLVYSERLGRWTPRVKKEHKSNLYGAFVIANVHITGRNGEEEAIRRFVSLKDLQKPSDNPLARFKAANR